MANAGRTTLKVSNILYGITTRKYSLCCLATLTTAKQQPGHHHRPCIPRHVTPASATSCRLYSSDLSTHNDVLTVRTVNGLHELSVPMLSRREKCRFTLQPFADTVGDLLERIEQEDGAIEDVHACNEAGELIAATTGIHIAMKQNFYLVLNDRHRYLVETSSAEQTYSTAITDDMRNLVASLYRTINSDKYLEVQRRHLLIRQERLCLELVPFEKLKAEMEEKAEKRTRLLSWLGLGLMGAQFGFMARLTWWEYSWDIMEPVTYFVGYATAIAAFGYYVITRQDYMFPYAREREFLITLHRKAQPMNFDIARYNRIRTELSCIERDLQRLQEPLVAKLTLPYLPSKKFEVDTSMP